MPTPAEIASRGATRYVNGTATAGDALKRGIRDSQEKWKTNTAAAQASWTAGVNEAALTNRFSRKVSATPAGRYGDSITLGVQQKYRENTASAQEKIKNVIQRNVTVSQAAMAIAPSRGRAGDEANYQRMNANARALRDEAVARHAGD